MEMLYKIDTATNWKCYLLDAAGIYYDDKDAAVAKVRDLERMARNKGAPQVLFRIEEIDMASEAAKELGRKGGTVKSERKAEAARENGAMPEGEGKRRGRPRKVEEFLPAND
jgi:hypothetical protein